MTTQYLDKTVKLEVTAGIDAGFALEARRVLMNVSLPEIYKQRDDWAFEMLHSHPKAKEVVDEWFKSKENLHHIISISDSDEMANVENCIKGHSTLRFRQRTKPQTLPLGFATGLTKIEWDSHILIALEELNSENGLFNDLTMSPGECIVFPTTQKLSLPVTGGGLAILVNVDLAALPKRGRGKAD